jgi:putative Mn2+ efflux pump MntP
MDWLSLVAIALALSMDAFAVAIIAGLTLKPLTKRHIFRLAFHFGLFQALMPMAGWAAGSAIHRYISEIDHWVSFGLLAIVGGKMILGALRAKESGRVAGDPTSGWDLVILSVATSIDALAVGLSMAIIGSSILLPALVIGLITASLTAAGMLLGGRVGTLWGKRVEIIGGLILIGIGIKIVVEHMV